ncbi:DUF2877 domain-containing protein [Serratia sp. SRS-8-S-2018]|uniref:DUF2877 domain-containing protein n=1 Tax=Serratia TaxID=613 RepID=UPI00097620AA|nr:MULTISPECIES: DUF2877 domain-containing protein [Serratia]EIT7184575.1 DUF2877 domain-containing protein [Serratia marcescens]EJC6392257.1 DUF2877 domain-containing protein [Serratia marcescens]OMP56478.1 hypothetical protein BES32_06425 [Serratia marcescens]RZF17903.1 hypothetical protein B7L62_09195 [Serratia marcescens]TPW51441.1 DUF2877 domain-containing protein [Serratia sp. SRS-8-S-2018]
MDIVALAGSRHVTQDYGALRCVGSFNNAINFLTENARLLTLHRAGSGLSPMGWQLGARDFDRVRHAMPSVRHCAFSTTGILLDALLVRPAATARDLGLAQRAAIADRPLAAVLQRCTAQCGLHGEIGRLVKRPLTPEPAGLARDFSRWLRGGAVDWRHTLGKGPGLTPSNDDTLLGLLLSAHLDSRIQVAGLTPFFAQTPPLEALTTLVSAHYLHYAERGVFATPLHMLAQGLQVPNGVSAAVAAVLNLGHFSGADTLLGVWLGVTTINALCGAWCEHEGRIADPAGTV